MYEMHLYELVTADGHRVTWAGSTPEAACRNAAAVLDEEIFVVLGEVAA